MMHLRGRSALSAFRRERLRRTLRDRVPPLADVAARFVYFVDLDAPLNDGQIAMLGRLLEARAPESDSGSWASLLVTPRFGTLSPWSSKATDIMHNCGLETVRRVERGVLWRLTDGDGVPLPPDLLERASPLLHDRMTQTVCARLEDAARLFAHARPTALRVVDVLAGGLDALRAANRALGLALSDLEMRYLRDRFCALDRNPHDVELMMFAQANSEHCRHKIFNSTWSIDGEEQPASLFQMIRSTHARHPGRILSAYRDNAAVTEGSAAAWFAPDSHTRVYASTPGELHILMKVETHNHPTAISPYPGAATGSGGEIRDEAAVGRGARSKAGLTGFSVSNLGIPGFEQPWEEDHGRPRRISSALEIMLEGPIGAAAFNNEFGRPALCGYFRTYEQRVPAAAGGTEVRGYHKPVMVAGGLGNIRGDQVDKLDLPAGSLVVVLGGPAMLIGLGGGAASSLATGEGEEQLDFASVQRDNAEMQRRCQEVIDACWRLGGENPVLSIHDVGAGGLSNAVPELVHAAGRGGAFELRAVPGDDPGMSPLEIWCNEAQERFVLAVAPPDLDRFRAVCERERCPFAVIGQATGEARLRLDDALFGNTPIDVPLDLVLGATPPLRREASRVRPALRPLNLEGVTAAAAAERVLRLPAVADKTFLVTIGDRTVGGLCVRDQMVGPWQVPVADCAVTSSDYRGHTGEAMAMGERAPLALADAPASGRMAIGEALTNLAAAPVAELGRVVLSANWMAACGHPGEDARLYDTVRAVALQTCPALGIAIPVGKDSLSMKTVWHEDGEERAVTAPLTLVISAFAPVPDVRPALTPLLRTDLGPTDLLLLDLGRGRNRLGGSALAQVFGQLGDEVPDLEDPGMLRGFFTAVQELNRRGRLLAYHDRSDGGLLVTLCEMAFAARSGLAVELPAAAGDPRAALFAEELGAVVQVRRPEREAVTAVFEAVPGLAGHVHHVGEPRPGDGIEVRHRGRTVLSSSRSRLHRAWSETTWRMQSLRDDPACALEEYDRILDTSDPGLSAKLGFDPAEDVSTAYAGGVRPRVAILREQGVNGHVEMAAAFHRAGFESVDVHMSDLAAGRIALDGFSGLVACGGFSYGDVLGAGGGWAGSILYDPGLRERFAEFFARDDTFALGVCNGCQMFARLAELIPGAEGWPRFLRNRSEQFEARLVRCEVTASPSLFLRGMEGSLLPVVVAHGEGRAAFPDAAGARRSLEHGLVCLRFVDNRGRPASTYPANPNGSPEGITGLTTPDGRVTILMPHPERVFRTVQHSWHPDAWIPGAAECANGPWLRMFRNARVWVG